MKEGENMAFGTILAHINGDEDQKPSFTGTTGKKLEFEDDVPQDTSIVSYA